MYLIGDFLDHLIISRFTDDIFRAIKIPKLVTTFTNDWWNVLIGPHNNLMIIADNIS